MPVPSGSDTDTLLARASEGDAAAAGEVLVRHAARLRRMVSVRMDPRLAVRVDASDVVQETLLVALQRLPEYLRERPLAFYPWLRQIALERLVHLWRQHFQARNRSVCREEQQTEGSTSGAEEPAHQFLAQSDSLLQRLVRKETLGRLREALTRLPPDDREVLVLRHLEQLSTAETAAVLGISETAAKQRHLRAIRRVRRLLGRELLGGEG